MSEITTWVSATFALCSALCAFSIWLDNQLDPALKTGILNNITGVKAGENDNKLFSNFIIRYYAALTTVYNYNNKISFIKRTLITSVTFIVILSLIQANTQPDTFKDYTLPFIKKLIEFDLKTVAFFVGLLIIDTISIYQTILFMRIAKSCNNFVEFAFVSAADLIMSFTLFITFIPLFITIPYLTKDKKDSTINFVLSTSAGAKSYSAYDAIREFLAFDPRDQNYSRADIDREVYQKGWSIISYSMLPHADKKIPPSIAGIVKNTRNSHSMLVQLRGMNNPEEIGRIIISIISKFPNVISVSSSDFYDNLFGSSYNLVSLKTDYTTSNKFLISNYFSIMSKVNFFDENVLRVVRLGHHSVQENDIYISYNQRSSLDLIASGKRSYYIYCDGMISVESRKNNIGVNGKHESCEKAVAISDFAIQGILHFATYDLEKNFEIPISPFALSSLIATVIFYYIAFCFIVMSLLFAIPGDLFRQKEEFFTNNLFLISSIIFSLFLIVPFALFSKFVFS